jgi:hypothetical protein
MYSILQTLRITSVVLVVINIYLYAHFIAIKITLRDGEIREEGRAYRDSTIFQFLWFSHGLFGPIAMLYFAVVDLTSSVLMASQTWSNTARSRRSCRLFPCAKENRKSTLSSSGNWSVSSLLNSSWHRSLLYYSSPLRLESRLSISTSCISLFCAFPLCTSPSVSWRCSRILFTVPSIQGRRTTVHYAILTLLIRVRVSLTYRKYGQAEWSSHL